MSYNYFTMNNLTHIDFTKKGHTMQLKMKFDVATYIPMDSKVRLVCNIVEEMNLDSVLSTYSVKGESQLLTQLPC